MKKLLIILFLLISIFCITSCTYSPPEGSRKRPHTYKEILAFAKSLDPNAIVSKKYTDIEDEYDWPYREWEAVINGINCHIVSVSDREFNDGIIFFDGSLAGEFATFYYNRIGTDYDYVVIKQNKFVDNYPEWKCEQTVHERYQLNKVYFYYEMSEFRMLQDDEFEQVWQTACEINEECEKLAIEKEIEFLIPVPIVYCSGTGESYLAQSTSGFFTSQDKQDFYKYYKELWEKLELDLPRRF